MFFRLSDQNIAEYCSFFFSKNLISEHSPTPYFYIQMDMYLAIFANLSLVSARHTNLTYSCSAFHGYRTNFFQKYFRRQWHCHRTFKDIINIFCLQTTSSDISKPLFYYDFFVLLCTSSQVYMRTASFLWLDLI